MNKITAFIIVKNGADLLPATLASLQGVADELVILDTGSEDGTGLVIAEAADSGAFAQVISDSIVFAGFGDAKQQSLDRVQTEWALSIDADETLSASLRARLVALKSDGLEAHDGWVLHRVNTVLGRQMRARNLSRDFPLRLFRTGAARFTPSLVHEGLVMAEGTTTARIDEPLLHNAMDNWSAYMKKVDHYTTLDVEGGRYRFRWWHLLTTGPATFLRQYVGRTGIIDGWPGFVWAATSAMGSVLRDWKLLKQTIRSTSS